MESIDKDSGQNSSEPLEKEEEEEENNTKHDSLPFSSSSFYSCSSIPNDDESRLSASDILLASNAKNAYHKQEFEALRSLLATLHSNRPNDVIVTTNLRVIEALTGVLSLTQLQEALQSEWNQISESEDSECHGILLYNLALISYYKNENEEARDILLKLQEGMDGNEYLSKFTLHLLFKVYFRLGSFEKAEELLPTLELTPIKSQRLYAAIILKTKNFSRWKSNPTEFQSIKMDSSTMRKIAIDSATIEFYKGEMKESQRYLDGSIDETGIFDNNLGVIHFAVKKNHLASYFFKNSLTKIKGIKKNSVIYNLGLSTLASSDPCSAFEIFRAVLPAYKHRPEIWLHLSECITSYVLSLSENQGLKAFKVLGNGKHRRIQILPSTTYNSSLGSSLKTQSSTNVHEDLNLNFASCCLRNALFLNSQSEKKNSINKDLKKAILSSYSYVSLLLGDYSTALSKATTLMELISQEEEEKKQNDDDNNNNYSNSNEYYKNLATLYSTDALIHLNRVDESLSKLEALLMDEKLGKVSLFNLSVALVLSSEYEKALENLKCLKDPSTLKSQSLYLQLYIYLKKGDIQRGKEIVSENLNYFSEL